MADLFDPRKGDSLSVLRQPMGASDFVAGDFYTYDDVPAGQTDYAMKHFTIAHDRKQILPLLRQALRLNRDLTVVATPWSPPAWMKTNELADRRPADRRPGDLPGLRPLLREVRAGLPRGRRAGARRDAAERAAEPQPQRLPRRRHAGLAAGEAGGRRRRGLRRRPAGHDDPRLRPQLVRAPQRHRDDAARRGPRDRLPLPAAALPAEAVVRRDRLPLLRRRPGRPDQAARRVPRHRALVHRVLRLARPHRPAGAGVLRHPEVAQPQPGAGGHPQLGLDRRQLEPRARPERRPAQRRLRHLHRRGHRRPGADGHPQRGVLHARAPRALRPARRAPHRQHVVRHHRLERRGDGRRVPQPRRVDVLVVHNENDDPRSFAVAQGGQSFDYTLPGGSLATFVWPTSKALDDGYRLLDLHGATATVVRRPPTRRNAVDDDATTRWTTGAAQQPGRRLQVDLGSARDVRPGGARHRAIDRRRTGPGSRRRLPARAAVDQHRRRRPGGRPVPAPGPARSPCSTCPARPARYLRLDQTGTAASWWSVADLRVYS